MEMMCCLVSIVFSSRNARNQGYKFEDLLLKEEIAPPLRIGKENTKLEDRQLTHNIEIKVNIFIHLVHVY
jgi:hypothetical protein